VRRTRIGAPLCPAIWLSQRAAPERAPERAVADATVGGWALWGRVAQLVAMTAGHGLRLAGRSLWRLGPTASESQASVVGRSLTELLEALGATFVKVGQVLSSRPDLLPSDVIVHLRRLQQDVEPIPATQLHAALDQGLGAGALASVEVTPLASASVAGVYRAQLHDRRPAAVKVRRPGLVVTVQQDLVILKAIARLLQRVPALRVVPVKGVAEEIAEAIRRQLNFEDEAANNRRFQANFAGYDGVRIPVLVEGLCSESVLTMEYLPDLRRLDSLEVDDEQAEATALVGLRVLYKMIFLDGFIHVDMHPGNIFVGPDGELVLLDLGLVAELDDEQRLEFAEFFVAIAMNDGRRCAGIVVDTARSLAPTFEPAAFLAAMDQLIDRYSGLDAGAFEVVRFATDLFDVQRRYGVTGSTAFTLVIVSLVVFEGIVKKIAPGLDFQAEARSFLATAYPAALARVVAG
jgi:ubiquinone biosynthesis protein